MANRALMMYGLLAVMLMGCAVFIAWRLQRLKVQREEAAKRAVIALEQMNLLTKQLREKGATAPADRSVAPGERLQQLYPGARRGDAGPSQA